MINLIKRDIISIWEKTKVFNILVFIVLVLSLIIPKDLLGMLFLNSRANSIVNILVPIISSVIIMVYAFATYIFLVFRMIAEIKTDEYSLLLASDKKPWEIVISKLLVNLGIAVIINCILIIFSAIISKFNSTNMQFFTFDMNFYDSIFEVISVSIFLFFAYVIAKSLKPSREKPIFRTFIIIIILGILMSIVNLFVLIICGAEISFMPTDAGFGFSTDELLVNQNMYNIITTILDYIYFAIFTTGSIYLLKEKFEK